MKVGIVCGNIEQTLMDCWILKKVD